MKQQIVTRRSHFGSLGPAWLLLVAIVACDGCPPPPAEEAPLDAGHDAARPDAGVDAGITIDPSPAADSGRPGDPHGHFFELPDAPRRASLLEQDWTAIDKGRGGRSLGFRITLADGTRGYFKPEQDFSAAHWYGELGAYYLDRELGLGRVSPSIGRRMRWEPFRLRSMNDERQGEVYVRRDGTVRGAFIWWIPDDLERLRLGHGWERWIRLDGELAVTPFQRPYDYRLALSRRSPAEALTTATEEDDRSDGDLRPAGAAGEPDHPDRPAELSDMILFDYLTRNVDRWGGDFTNVRTRGAGGPLIYLDNGAGFTDGELQRTNLMDTRLTAVQRFRRSTVEAIRGFSLESFRRRIDGDPLAPILNERQLAALMERRRFLLEHVDRMHERFGDRVWLD